MNDEFDYEKSLSAFMEMYNEQQDRIKSALNDRVNSLSLNTLKIPEINVSKVDAEPLGAKLKGAFNIDSETGKQFRSAVENINIKKVKGIRNTLDNITLTAERLCNIFTKDFRDFLNNVGIKIREGLLLELEILGELEWCYWGIEALDDSELWDMSPTYLKEYLDEYKNASVKDIDAYITKYFTKKIIISISDRIVSNLDKNDTKKFNQAMIDFGERRYLDCANLLASLIDSQSIKQRIYDLNNNKSEEQINKISQGWKVFYKVFCDDLLKYFEDEFSERKSYEKEGKKGLNKIMEKAKTNLINYEIKIPLLFLILCMNKFFEDKNWLDYPQKPEVINRHWLMHGMYDIDDITKSDCIKLLLMLNQLTDIYTRIKKGEL